MQGEEEKDAAWPFDAWLKIAVSGFRLSPREFWDMSLRDWLVLTKSTQVPAVGRAELAALIERYPDGKKYEDHR